MTAHDVNLTNCDREPIHTPGSIQPHGILLVLSEPDLAILQISNNTQALLGIPPEKLLGQHLSILLEPDYLNAIASSLQGDFEYLNPVKLLVRTYGKSREFNGIIHRSPQKHLIVELEPCHLENFESVSTLVNFYTLTRGTLTKLQQVSKLSELSAILVTEVRKITGFDRVMVYRFDTSGSGQVIAEDKLEELEPYLGLHYPDTDIPKQARHLYIVNPLRLIPDINYQPVGILSLSPLPPVDLTFSILRSVSPIHIEYLKNMGPRASMSISLIKNNQLWGLIACHHQTPRFVPYEIRTIYEFLGKVMSLELVSKEENHNLDFKLQLKSIQTKFIDTIARSENLTDALVQDRVSLLKVVNAEGAAVCLDGHLMLIGKTPKESEIYDLIAWLNDKFNNYLFVTDSLPQQYPPAMEFKEVGSGLLALSITKISNNYILWFRPEILQQVSWAGNPQKPTRIETDGSLTIFPRQSFNSWKETVRTTSLLWDQYEIDGAMELRSAIVGIVLRKADELATINLELQRSNNELDAFSYIASHDLKEPLRAIHNYSTFLLEDYIKVLDEEGISKLETLVRLTKRMEDIIDSLLHFSHLGRQNLNMQIINLNDLLKNVAEVFRMSLGNANINVRIPESLPTIGGDQALLEEVFTNLIGNSFKYNDNQEKWVEIECFASENEAENMSPFWTFCVRDNGIGIRHKHLETIFRIFKRLHAPGKYGGGTGAGLTIVKKIIERHNGKIWVESTVGQGSTFYFTLPR